jgi:hypothetical protein
MAGRHGGVAEFLAVDSDAVHQTALQWPEVGSGYCRLRSGAAFHEPGHRSYEQLPRPGSERWKALFDEAAEGLGGRPDTALEAFGEGFIGRAGAEGDYVSRWCRGVAAVDRLLEIESPRFRLVSELFSSSSLRPANSERAGPENRASAAAFVAHLLLNAEAFAAAYNAALAEYRRRRGIRGRQHPIPDLEVGSEAVELPLWLLHDSEPRQRLSVSPGRAEAVRLWAGPKAICRLDRREVCSDPGGVLASCLGGWEIRPRALTLTMYARLLACDLFIHGIGGAKYDQITDGIIRRFWGVEPPAYACVSATLRLPLSAYEVSEADRQSYRRRMRDIRFNLQRYVAGAKVSSEFTALVSERAQGIGESSRLRQEEPGNRAARREAFEHIRRVNESLLRAAPGQLEAARHDLAAIEAQLDHNRIVNSREWFFALYPVEKLQALREALPFGRHPVTS